MFLASCTHPIVNRIKELEKRLDEQKRYKPAYMTNPKSFKSIHQLQKEQYDSTSNSVPEFIYSDYQIDTEESNRLDTANITEVNIDSADYSDARLFKNIDYNEYELSNLKTDSLYKIKRANKIQSLIDKDDSFLNKYLDSNQVLDKTNKDSLSKFLLENAESAVLLRINSINSDLYPKKITIRAIVLDSAGGYISGLAPPHYAGKSDYKKYWLGLADSCKTKISIIKKFEVKEVKQSESKPKAIVFTLDHSGSMAAYEGILQKAVQMLLGAIRSGDMVSIVKYANNPFTELPLTGDSKVIRTHNTIVRPPSSIGGGTATFDALIESINELKKADDKYEKVVVLFSDGADGSSDSSIDSVLKDAKANNISIYSIAFGNFSANFMERISRYTNGKFYTAFFPREIPYIFRDIYLTMNNYYEITYTPPVHAGKHKAIVRINIPELLSSITQSGYYDKSVFTEDDPLGKIALFDLEFDFAKADVKPESLPTIENIAEAMQNNPKINIQIIGHTDDLGSEETNMTLSRQRAISVKTELVRLGIESSRISIKGMGESSPLVPNTNDENRRKNRRTEFVIVK